MDVGSSHSLYPNFFDRYKLVVSMLNTKFKTFGTTSDDVLNIVKKVYITLSKALKGKVHRTLWGPLLEVIQATQSPSW